jgi:hypothetical protein
LPRIGLPIQPVFSLAHIPLCPGRTQPCHLSTYSSREGPAPRLSAHRRTSTPVALGIVDLRIGLCLSHSRLRSLCCSLLSQGVYATMNRSDPSCAPPSSALRLHRAVPKRVVGTLRHARVLPRLRTYLFPSSRRQPRHGVYPVLDFASLTRARPPVSAESRSLSFRADVWLGPFTLRLSLPTGGITFAQVPRRDLNPLDMCAAGRT